MPVLVRENDDYLEHLNRFLALLSTAEANIRLAREQANRFETDEAIVTIRDLIIRIGQILTESSQMIEAEHERFRQRFPDFA